MAESDKERFLRQVQSTIDYCARLGSLDSLTPQIIDNLKLRMLTLSRDINRAGGILISDDEKNDLISIVNEMNDEIDKTSKNNSGASSDITAFKTKRTHLGTAGAPKLDISKDQLVFLANISNEELDDKVKNIIGTNKRIGPNSIRIRLAMDNTDISRQRVRDACHRVDPVGCALRSIERQNVHRTYKVAGPNSLWHIDGNHKLIRWNIVIHGGIDGYSRFVTFLHASNNNQSTTVYDLFIEATTQHGVPSRIRVDHGGENVDICTFMEGYRGTNRGSGIKCKSAHNQRIERLWAGSNNSLEHITITDDYGIEDNDSDHEDNSFDEIELPLIHSPLDDDDMQQLRSRINLTEDYKNLTHGIQLYKDVLLFIESLNSDQREPIPSVTD
ncbi:unnamed protein product [Mytilus coruscus]|uniref:Integrase catalytic domain-containing protein n=1 Tax=Mytilus coruscus TaxID=42192 RepID=A0A6J8ABZ5_MYTCO|nr:unnamed protein product [Mytilus coruscus]